MIFSESWLREWVNPDADLNTLCHQLTMAGLEVEGTQGVAAEFTHIVVGEVLAVEAHPDADKLRICKVNAGAGESLQIVCGAPNVHVGMKAPLAKIGAVLPGLKIKKGKLRGVESFGMLCSAKELGLADDASGLLPLPSDAPVGEDLRAYLQLEDRAIELSITPNRGDCLGICGIAREVGALFKAPVTEAEIKAVPPQCDDTLTVELLNSTACPHYAGRILKNINPQAETPLWMQERLRRSGLRSISAVVDVTNYVLLELGQPMHAFDLAKLSGGIRVRNAEGGEKLTLLDEQEITLDADTLVIADHQQAHALAGVMGGLASSVGDTTGDIFLESAFFSPLPLAGCARRYGLQTDSSYRFERGVDFSLQVKALERATALILDICGGTPGPVTEVTAPAELPRLQPITLRAARIQRLLGLELTPDVISDCLTRLGMSIHVQDANTWTIVPPAYRFDIRIEADLIEEIARVVGYANLPRKAPQIRMDMRIPRGTAEDLKETLVQRGYQEAITYSFVDPAIQAKLLPNTQAVPLQNPISNDMAVMRTTLWSGLLPALAYNQKRQQDSVRLFETGLRFIDGKQEPMLAGVVWGLLQPEQWSGDKRKADFYDVKGDVEALLARTGKTYEFIAAEHPALHPGQSAQILSAGETIGWLGTLHPSLSHSLDLSSDVYLFEVSGKALLQTTHIQFRALSRFPSVRRDVAIVLDQTLAAKDVINCIHTNGTDLLTDVRLFDVYQGKGIPDGKKSLALGLSFRAASRNLTEADADTAMSAILTALKQQFDASLRD